MKKPRIKKLRASGSGNVYQCHGCIRHDLSPKVVVERFGYGDTPTRAYYHWLTGNNLLGAFA